MVEDQLLVANISQGFDRFKLNILHTLVGLDGAAVVISSCFLQLKYYQNKKIKIHFNAAVLFFMKFN
jgi:hypothetical protein